ncbi:TetR/AcrR family transcriptional regulator [Actinomadura sp. WMMB 499]|uniref:TetR/AcrR family transcriptional regulator n=1 Tax=Actinomadura sp. WMMB 499 TaxID=1219491 RepID=UPI001244080D|nr:TetR family transcriptional regulator [Actinomadura sp. WMMB 499]QFG25537.1 TetR/AcrR family transcriptional regulator [Actinomadura sp. WMMB 499]
MSARDQILSATLRLIGEQGIGAVTNRAVAKAAGVSLGSLTYHFPSQDALLREALQTYVDLEIARITARVADLADAGIAPGQAPDQVEKAVTEFARGPEQLANLELHLHAARDPGVRETSTRSVEAYDRLAAAVLTALGLPDAERHAPTVVALLYGLAIRRLATGGTTADGTADAFRLLLFGAVPRESGNGPHGPRAG